MFDKYVFRWCLFFDPHLSPRQLKVYVKKGNQITPATPYASLHAQNDVDLTRRMKMLDDVFPLVVRGLRWRYL